MKARKQNKLQLTAYILLLITIVLTPLATTAWAAGYEYYAAITIDHDYVGADHTDFTILISGTYDGTAGEPDIRTVGNGGNIENTDAAGGVTGSLTVPADLVFSPNTDGSAEYDFEYEQYDPVTGTIIAWVQIPTMDGSDDQTIYIVYSDAAVTTTQEDIDGTWNAGYIGVYHMAEASGNVNDSTSNNHNSLSIGGSPVYQTPGHIGWGIDFEESSSEFFNLGTVMGRPANYTIESLLKPESWGNAAVTASSFSSASDPLIWGTIFRTDDSAEIWVGNGATSDHSTRASEWNSTNYPNSSYTQSVGTVDGSNLRLYRDGVLYDNEGQGVANSGTAYKFSIGRLGDFDGFYYDGKMDEFRISNIMRGTSWLLTTNNTYDPATFYSMGSEEGGGPTPTPTETYTPTPTASDTPTVTPTPSDTPIPSETPVNSPTPTATPIWYTCDPSVVIDQDLQDEIAAALIADVPNEDANCWAITDIYTVGDYSMISLAGLEADEPVDYNDWTFQDALWVGTAIIRDNGDTTYTTGLDEDATYLTLLGESSFSDPNDGADQGGGGGNWIWFPWLAGTQGFYGSRGVHRASVALPGWVAVDFVGGVNYGDTTFPNMVYGSYTEPIKSVCRDGTAVGLTTENFYYLHLEESTSFQPGLLIRQGQPIGSLVMGSFNDKCGWASQNATSYHLHFGFKPSTGYVAIENWVLNTSDEIWRNGATSRDVGGSLLAEWPDHQGPIPTVGPSVTPGGPTVTPGPPPPPPRVYGGDSLWDPFIYGLYDMAQTTAERFPEHTTSGIGSQITSGAEIAIRVAFVLLTSNFDLTISIIIFGLISAAEIVRLIYAIYLGVKKLIPLIG